MKKTRLITTLLSLVLLLTGCNNRASNQNNDSNDKNDNNNNNNDGNNNNDDNNDAPIVDNGMSLFMYGDLYYQQTRSIYVKFTSEKTGKDIIWESTNEDIIALTSVESVLPEALLTAVNYGTSTIIAKLKDDETIIASKTITIRDDGYILSDERFDSLKQSIELNINEKQISYNSKYEEIIDTEYEITTIFEEIYDSSSTDNEANLTDAYQFTCLNKTKNKIVMNNKYVRSKSDYVAKERINSSNKIEYELVRNSDDNKIAYDSTYYVNPFGKESLTTAYDWLSFDNKKTYHFTGNFETANYLLAYFTYEDAYPDDMYLDFTDENNIKFIVEIDPYNSDKDETTKYGAHYEGTISKIGTATIDHLKPYTHETYHDNIENARENMANLKNYSLTYTVDQTSNSSYNVSYSYYYNEDTIDVVNNYTSVKIHTGVHKKEDGSYYEYEYNPTEGTLYITKDHTTPFESEDIKRYPTFDFASEIFSNEVDGYYESRSNNGSFINYCAYTPYSFSYSDYEDEGKLKLSDDNNYINEVNCELITTYGEATFKANYSNFNETKIDIDFSKATTSPLPTSWKEYDSWIYDSLVDWNMEQYIPFMAVEDGIEYHTPGWSNGTEGVAWITVGYFDDTKALEFEKNYIKVLQENGYELTTETDTDNVKVDYSNPYFYKKGDAKISIGRQQNYANGGFTGEVRICLHCPDIVCGGTD